MTKPDRPLADACALLGVPLEYVQGAIDAKRDGYAVYCGRCLKGHDGSTGACPSCGATVLDGDALEQVADTLHRVRSAGLGFDAEALATWILVLRHERDQLKREVVAA